MRRTLKFRAYPTVSQGGRAIRLLRDHCDLYNAALEERRDAWVRCGVRIGYKHQSAQLREVRRNDPDGRGRHSFTAQQQTLRQLDAVFGSFFRRARVSRRKVGFPRFKPYQRLNQVRFVAGDGAKWIPAGTGRWAHVKFQAVGQPKVRQHRRLRGRVKMLQLEREGRRWYVLVVADVEAELLPSTGRAAGADVGMARSLTTSDGLVIGNPRVLATAQTRTAHLQRRKAGARFGSGNRKRLRQRLAKEWRKVRNQRRDFHHKTARALVDADDVLALEDLLIGGLTASARGTVDEPGRNVAQEAGLQRSILDAGWGQFTRILDAKAESAGRRVIRVNPGYTSPDCNTCGARCTRPKQEIIVCPDCGGQDADRNGARNIATRAGLGSGQALVA